MEGAQQPGATRKASCLPSLALLPFVERSLPGPTPVPNPALHDESGALCLFRPSPTCPSLEPPVPNKKRSQKDGVGRGHQGREATKKAPGLEGGGGHPGAPVPPLFEDGASIRQEWGYFWMPVLFPVTLFSVFGSLLEAALERRGVHQTEGTGTG